jgi:16S rRNA (uracil1498-N3)-methyltransferase
MPRFLVPDLAPGTEIELPSAEARHATRSRRLRAGDEVTLFDGRGRTCPGRIARIEGEKVTVKVGEAVAPSASRFLAIASALPKGKRLAWMIQKLAELGVTEFIPVAFRRSVVRWTSSTSQRMEKIAIEAAKQSDRSDLMRLRPEITTAELAALPGPAFIAVPGAPRSLIDAARGSPGARVIIGPEGGFEPGEVETLRAEPVALGRTVLRVETAAIAAAAILGQS